MRALPGGGPCARTSIVNRRVVHWFASAHAVAVTREAAAAAEPPERIDDSAAGGGGPSEPEQHDTDDGQEAQAQTGSLPSATGKFRSRSL